MSNEDFIQEDLQLEIHKGIFVYKSFLQAHDHAKKKLLHVTVLDLEKAHHNVERQIMLEVENNFSTTTNGEEKDLFYQLCALRLNATELTM